MSVDLKLPFGSFCRLSISEYRKGLNGVELNAALLDEQIDRAHAAWHESRDKKKEKKRARAAAFVPPTPEEVTAYSISIDYPLDGLAWCLHYGKKGWKTSGSARMVDWKLAVQQWKREGWKTARTPSMPPRPLAMQDGPEGWVAWARQNIPDWQRFTDEQQGTPLPSWGGLRMDEREAIVSQMKSTP